MFVLGLVLMNMCGMLKCLLVRVLVFVVRVG